MPRETLASLRAKTAELEGEIHVLRGLAVRDPLTGVYNRRAFNDAMEREAMLASRLAAVRRYNRGLLVIDINDFKGINDTYGHPIGDEFLRQIAEVAQQSVRSTDIVCRIGGDEFAVILSDPIDISGVTKAADRIDKALSERPITTENGYRLYVTVSIGGSIAEVAEHPTVFSRRVDDILMQQAKPRKVVGQSTVFCV